MLGGKIHRATVTDADLNYVGSITIAQDLMQAAGFSEYERVAVANVNNGNRLETYIIAGAVGSGTVCLNGAAAHLFKKDDKVIIMSYVQLDDAEIIGHKPKVVFVDDANQIAQVKNYEHHGDIA
jgi:aspartate 1-decarboxylase